MHKLMAGFLL